MLASRHSLDYKQKKQVLKIVNDNPEDTWKIIAYKAVNVCYGAISFEVGTPGNFESTGGFFVKARSCE